MSRDPAPVPPEKECYYDDVAWEKRAARAHGKWLRSLRYPHAAPPPLRRGRIDLLINDEERNRALTFTPMPKQRAPEWLPENELRRNELWLDRVLPIIVDRIDTWNPYIPSSQSPPETASKPSTQLTPIASSVTRVLAIGELLTAILQAATPESQLIAYNVSQSWRATAEYVIVTNLKTGLWSTQHPCPPVIYGDLIDPALSLPQPSIDEIEQFEEDLAAAHEILPQLSETHNETTSTFFPARITQAPLSIETASSLQIFDRHQENLVNWGTAQFMRGLKNSGEPFQHLYPTFGTPGSPEGQPGPHVPKWLDFTQFHINPYFSGLFPDRISIDTGRMDITMPCNRMRTMINRSVSHKAWRDIVESTQLSQPPCKTVKLYCWESMCNEQAICKARELEKLSDNDGITVGALLRTLEEYSAAVIEDWVDQAEFMRSDLAFAHWKHDLWFLPGKPKISIVLSNDDEENTPPQQWCQLLKRESRLKRQREWMPEDVMKPPVLSLDTSVELLPSIYRIGIEEDLFANYQTPPWDRRTVWAKVLQQIMSNLEAGRECSEGIPQAPLPIL